MEENYRELYDAQNLYGDEDEALRKALEMSAIEDGKEEFKHQPVIVPRDEPMNGHNDFYHRNVEIRYNPGPYNRQNEEIDIRNYDVDNNLDMLLDQSRAGFRRDSNRRRNLEQNYNPIHPRSDRRRNNGNDLLSEIPSVVRERIRNPFANVRAGAADLRPRYRRVVDPLPRYPLYRNPIHRNPHPRNEQMEADIDNMSYDQLLEFENNLGNVSKGYHKEDINSIPIMFTFTHGKGEEENCPVCLDEIASGTPQLSIACRHQFHINCIKKALENSKKCPVCKTDALSFD
jgi:hypothetical protein